MVLLIVPLYQSRDRRSIASLSGKFRQVTVFQEFMLDMTGEPCYYKTRVREVRAH